MLASHRIRRITAGEALAILRMPALTVAPGTTSAATAHIRTTAERARLLDRQLKKVVRHLDTLIDHLAESETSEESEPGWQGEQRDTAILRSLPGVGRIVLATLLAEAHQAVQARDYRALRIPATVTAAPQSS